VLFHNSEILVADQPHGMPVTPAGSYLQRSLLYRLRKATGIGEIAPLHRLDRDTAGLVLFSLNPATRAAYHQLFATKELFKEYMAISHLKAPVLQRQWLVQNRIGRGEPWFRQQIIDGPVNAVTEIELLDIQEGRGLFRLKPQTGKKHQLRLHMASIEAPIEGDKLYPCLLQEAELPRLQLLAHRLAFVDPLDRKARELTSQRTLAWSRHL
jgi:tRNA pseudouridine32 synthase/23S rRNA pseudouridine746 synthase